MGVEIERKFLVNESLLPPLENGRYISQGYVETQGLTVVRARVKGEKGYLTIKGENKGVRRAEFEYEIPVEDAKEIINSLCGGRCVEKTRYEIQVAKHLWELDIFHGDNEGLIVAEVELSDENEEIELPDWVANEVSNEAKYFNANLLKHPFKHW